MTYELIGELLQAFGVLVILSSQAFFVWKARKKPGSLGTAFLERARFSTIFCSGDFESYTIMLGRAFIIIMGF